MRARPGIALAALAMVAAPARAETVRTFISLGNGANAVIEGPAIPGDAAHRRIGILVAHPESINTFDYFIGHELAMRGYRVLMLNTYGPEVSYEQFLSPIAVAMTALRKVEGIERIVLAGHSTGGPELTAYQDVAENGAQACRGAARIARCDGDIPAKLPPADGLMLLDTNAGAPERTIALDPAIDPAAPLRRNAPLDMYAPANGFDAAHGEGSYSPAFQTRYYRAQAWRAQGVLAQASQRLAAIGAGQGLYGDDEPFVVPGSDLHVNGARLDLADGAILSRTARPHPVLHADGTRSVEVLRRIALPAAKPQEAGLLHRTVLDVTVKHYLSFEAMRVGDDFTLGADTIKGIDWASTANSVPGNVAGIHVPTLVMAATCAPHMVFAEIAFDRSAAKDKAMVGIEGANHALQPCRPDYGDTRKRAFDAVDQWLMAPGRF